MKIIHSKTLELFVLGSLVLGCTIFVVPHAIAAGYEECHIPSDLVVDRGASEIKSSSSLDFLFLCSVWTTFCCLISDKITL